MMSDAKEIYLLKQPNSEFDIYAGKDWIELGAEQERGNYNPDSTAVLLNEKQAMELVDAITKHFKSSKK